MIEILDTTIPTDKDGYAVTAVDSFIDGLTTPRYSVIEEPHYGTDLHKLKHRSFSSGWIIDLRRCLKDACIFDPRLVFADAHIDASNIAEGKVLFDVILGSGYKISGVARV